MRAWWLLVTVVVACGGDEGKGEGSGGDADTDTDSDTDADTDTDSGHSADSGGTTETGADLDDEGCPDAELVEGTPLESRTDGEGNDARSTCGGERAPDVSIEFTAPEDGRYAFVTAAGFDTVLSAFDSCAGGALGCNDDGSEGVTSELVLDLAAGQTVLLVVDGFGGSDQGPFALDVLRPAVDEVDCTNDVDDDFDGDRDCADWQCRDAPECVEVCGNGVDDDGDGMEDCYDASCDFDPSCPEDCDDGLDNDNDYDRDCNDPGCSFDAACAEVCDDGLDNDGDYAADCNDAWCAGEPACAPTCGVAWTQALPGSETGDNTGMPNVWRSAGCSGGFGPEVTFEFTAPTTDVYVFDTFGSAYDTVLYAVDTCVSGAVELGCDDDTGGGTQSELVLALTAGQSVVLVLDAFGDTDLGGWVLNVW
jgi:hypothetical protein